MIAFILAGIVFVLTVLLCLLQVFAASMSDAPSMDSPLPIKGTFITGCVITLLLVASHWIAPLGW